MKSNTGPMPSTTKKQLSRFLVAGCSAVGTDLATYSLLLQLLPPSFAKGGSFLLGTIVAYVINKYWTFEKASQPASDALKFGALYAVTLGANVGVNHFSLWLIPGALPLAFLAATGTSTFLNFLGQKYWVFKA